MTRAPLFGAALFWLVVSPRPAWAQTMAAEMTRVVAGARHVATEVDHLLAILALALLAAQGGRRAAVMWTPAALAAGLAIGAFSGSFVPPLVQVETVNLASIAILGALVALGAPLPASFPVICGLIFGLGHGYANALDLGGKRPPTAFVLGLVAAALVVVVAVSLVTRSWQTGWRMVAVRAVGSWICAIGTMVLALQLAGE